MVLSVQDYRNRLERKKGQRDQILLSIEEIRVRIDEFEEQCLDIEEAKLILQTVAKKTQQQLEYHVSEIVTLALAAVFDEPYEFEIDFVIRRGKTEADLFFVKNGEKEIPLESSGGGPADIASFALRVAMWNLQNPQSRNCLILDEPFKHLKGEIANRKAIQMVKKISEKLNLQIIMVSDERAAREDIEKGADRIFEVSIRKGVSEVKN